MSYETLLVEVRGPVGLITLNRPKALNALSGQTMDELTQALDALEADTAIGAIVLTGSEKAFAAGADIKEMKDQTIADAFNGDFITRNWERVTRCRKPVIAAVAGYALGGGGRRYLGGPFSRRPPCCRRPRSGARYGGPQGGVAIFAPRSFRVIEENEVVPGCCGAAILQSADGVRHRVVSLYLPPDDRLQSRL